MYDEHSWVFPDAWEQRNGTHLSTEGCSDEVRLDKSQWLKMSDKSNREIALWTNLLDEGWSPDRKAIFQWIDDLDNGLLLPTIPKH
jgi:hypothetical protein